MKAVRINQWGHPAQLEDIPLPTPNSDEVLVRIQAASINPVDSAIAAGYLQSVLTVPMTLGTDFAGDVVTIGADVKHVKPGDAVYGMLLGRGAFAEFAIAKANEIAQKPRLLDYVQAAAVPLAALTAWQTLFDLAQLQGGERLLVHGAGGGVGSFAIQLAKENGAYVIGSDIPDKAAFLQELGVDQVINAQEQQFEDVVRDVDVVLHLVMGGNLELAYTVLKPGGRFVTTVGQPSQEEAERRGIRASGALTQPTVDHLTTVAERIDAGKLKVFVNRTFPLDEAQAALEYRQTGTTHGKVVLVVN